MRIVTYNLLAGGSARRSTHWELIQQRFRPDILLSQECRPPPAAQGSGSSLWARAAERGWGTGIFLRRGAIRAIPVRGFKGWVIGGELDDRSRLTKRPVRVFSIHCPAGDHGYVNTMGRILDRLAEIASGADLILGGDFNVAAGFRGPDEPIRTSPGERRLLERIAGEFALIPCWQTMYPLVPLAQTLRWMGNRAAPYHCDGIFVPRSWRRFLRSCEIVSGPEWDALSDHNPVVATLAPAFLGARGALGTPPPP